MPALKPIARNFSCLAALAIAALATSFLGGCERQLFKDTDTLNDRRVRYFDDYDGETVKAANARRKQSKEWGLGLPGGFGGGGD